MKPKFKSEREVFVRLTFEENNNVESSRKIKKNLSFILSNRGISFHRYNRIEKVQMHLTYIRVFVIVEIRLQKYV